MITQLIDELKGRLNYLVNNRYSEVNEYAEEPYYSEQLDVYDKKIETIVNLISVLEVDSNE